MEVHLGIDLAWGTTAPSGLAAVDVQGRLIDSAVAVTDDEISGWLERPDWQVLTVAVDAPLIVTNPTGQRRCELEVSRAYGAYGASCHASNLSRPYFNPPRATVLASRMGWTVDPRHRGDVERAACIEVYPHAAMVGLFHLPAVLPYKGRGGRSLDVRRTAFLELVRRMEELEPLDLSSSPRWATIRNTVENAGRPVHLERVEDEVDAIVCAHLAWLWHTQPASLTVYGTSTDGYIVAPPPPMHAPMRRKPSIGAVRSGNEVAAAIEDPAAPSGARGTQYEPSTVAFEVDGVPATFATAGEGPWREAVNHAAAAAMRSREPLSGRLEVTVHFRLPAPSRVGLGWDLDNLLKPTLDALLPVLGARAIAGPLQADDERVDRIVASKRTAHDGERLGASIQVTRL